MTDRFHTKQTPPSGTSLGQGTNYRGALEHFVFVFGAHSLRVTRPSAIRYTRGVDTDECRESSTYIRPTSFACARTDTLKSLGVELHTRVDSDNVTHCGICERPSRASRMDL